MSKPTIKRLERIEQGMLTLLQLNRLFSERTDELEKRVERAEQRSRPSTANQKATEKES